ncbi:MAG: SIR2 family NAD-dependent protein deacylase [Lachnospiraceae bacterium]
MLKYKERLEKAKAAISEASYILIGGGAGLSDAAGLTYTGKRFTDNFAPFIEKYGFEDLYTSSFYPFQTQEERWAYWAKHISINRYESPAMKLYKDIYRLASNKDHFVLTTNVDYQFQKAGFAYENVFMIQGNYGYFQCEKGCHNRLYDNEEQVKDMIAHTQDCIIPTSLVPKCPVCGEEMDIHIHYNKYFVRNEDWQKAERQYQKFLKRSRHERIIYLEMGIGLNTPSIIRIPFERLTHLNDKATLIRFNRDYPQGEAENETRTIAFAEDMSEIVRQLIL